MESAEELHIEGLLSYKYDFKCPSCNKDYTAYERMLKKTPYYCDKCGELISHEIISEKSWMIYSINKNELLNFQIEDDEIDFVKGTLGKGIVFDIKDKIIEAKSERKKEMKIFIGSSKEAEAEMERIGVIY